ncbi:MAG: tyrosine protein phosphatase [Gammaproteobacteria bacterium CG_4_10_14_0_8_um_filter_38_16]|nr:MAG: tyrosine protein phosphatase [Gammaproteobacteria bacterium CG_4_10_14_0_8_um_filter_38_16]PJA03345.1 MAG: tyrosine protein phosphatase [Gammaproteobacteria bacterium CG_4_10_14_0_2_um_filter_38_22]PJB10659.1 MAG: tyrosine protein phosphatase [Gammaproteobacteria bacterium CG_4_9_14_3_um_filter_38_9]
MRCTCRVVKKSAILIAILLIIALLTVGGRLAYNFFGDNVHNVIPGKIYRTAQLDQAGLKKYTRKFHLKTIINLRGSWPSNHWYQVESHFAKIHHLHYYSLQFSAYHVPTKKMLRKLVQLLQTAPQPLAFHCEGGADRTGMAAAISVILYDKNATAAQIERQASWHYNAVSPRTVGYQVMRNYFAWLKKNHHVHSSKLLFLEWMKSSVKMKPYKGWFVV